MTPADSPLSAARAALAEGRIEPAAQALQAHLRGHPGDAAAIHLLGTAAERARAIREAESLYRRAAALADPDAPLSLAALLARTARHDDALAALAPLLDRDPAHAAALALKAGTLVQARRLAAADAAYETLLARHPHDWHAWMSHGHLLKSLGRIAAAEAAYRRALAELPGDGAGPGIVWWALANLKTVRFTAGDHGAMQAALADSTDDADRTHLHFALGNTLPDPAAAFDHLRRGNALRFAHAPHDADRFSAIVRRSEALFTRDFFAARAGAGAPAPDPIFILGLPRSGSTLVEQILASHPLVEGTEELHALNRIAGTLAQGRDSWLDAVPALPPSALRALGTRYLAATRRFRTTDAPFFTDKMPSNWVYAGLIRLILPNARIIDVRRDPMACGFANYAQHFHWGNNFAYDLESIGRFYADNVRHMAHVDVVAPGAVHHLSHEALVADPEAEIRRLLDYLNLPFDPACLRFHETGRAVHTPSTDQVRRPINADGLTRWKVYEPWLAPLAEGLASAS